MSAENTVIQRQDSTKDKDPAPEVEKVEDKLIEEEDVEVGTVNSYSCLYLTAS